MRMKSIRGPPWYENKRHNKMIWQDTIPAPRRRRGPVWSANA